MILQLAKLQEKELFFRTQYIGAIMRVDVTTLSLCFVFRKKGIMDCSRVPSFNTVSQLRRIKETNNFTPNAKWGVVIPESSLERILP